MKKTAFVFVIAMSVAVLAMPNSSEANNRKRADRHAANHSQSQSWHEPYYHTSWGRPLALVVPPTARTQTHWGWGVTQSSVTPIYQQFKRPFPGEESGEYADLSSTPNWPSHTNQFGVYYIRGPWR